MIIIGVDLGKKGGWVALESGKPVKHGLNFEEVYYKRDRPTVFVEKPLKNRQGTAVAALTSMHRDFGYFMGYLAALRQRWHGVEYHEWSRLMLSGGKYPAAMRCRELWPDYPEIAEHEGLSDAALIAEYGRLLLERGR